VTRPNRNTLHNVVHYLAGIGLTVYGPCMDLDTGDRLGNLMDYDADQVVKYRALKERHPDVPHDPEDDDAEGA
jgi:hypothetical protein